MRIVSNKATQTPRVAEVQRQDFLLSSIICRAEGRICHKELLRTKKRNLQAWCARLGAEVGKEEELETGRQVTESAAGGAKQV